MYFPQWEDSNDLCLIIAVPYLTPIQVDLNHSPGMHSVSDFLFSMQAGLITKSASQSRYSHPCKMFEQ